MGDQTLVPIEGGLAKEQSIASRVRVKLASLSEVLKEARDAGVTVTLIDGQREMLVSPGVRAAMKVAL